MAQLKDLNYSEIQLKFDGLAFTNFRDSFQISLMKEPKKKKKSPEYFFFMQSGLLIVTLVFNLSNKTLSIINSFKRENKNSALVHFSMKRRLFYIPHKNQIIIRDETLKHFLLSIETEKEVDTVVLLDQQNILLIYDSLYYYELDLEELQFRRKLQNRVQSFGNQIYQMDFTLLNPLVKWTAMFHGNDKPMLTALNMTEALPINNFPYQSLIKSFNQSNYRDHVLNFSEYYFKAIGQNNNKDLFYGAMNPLLIAIYHNDSNLLEDLLEHYTYPSFISNYISPIEFAFALNHRTNIKVLCDNLLKSSDDAHMSRADFKILLRTDIHSCHRLIANILGRPKKKNIIPKLLYMENPVQARFEDYLTSLLIQLKSEEELKDDEDLDDNSDDENYKNTYSRKTTISDSVDASSFRHIKRVEMLWKKEREIEKSTAKFVEIHNEVTHFKSEVQISTLPFKYNFQMGTEDSVLFVDEYSNSNCEEFIFSDFAEVINYKWKEIKLPHIILFCIYLLFVISFNISCIFLPNNTSFRYLSISFTFIQIIYEIIQVIVYSTFKPSRYFLDAYNIIDWIIFLASLFYSFYLYQFYLEDSAKIYSIILLIIIYYRGLSLMRIFDMFTSLIGILNIIFVRLLVFFFILIYLYFCCAFLIFRISEAEYTLTMTDVYYRIILGSIEGDAFEERFSTIPMIIGSMFVTIFLINILIAYLSNLFSRLEEQQKFQEMQEKAEMILDIEIIVRFFKYYITGHISVRKEYELEFYKRMLRDANIKGNIEFEDKNKNKVLKQILQAEKYLYILKKIELSDNDNSENVYQKVKIVNKSIMALNSNISKKFRTTDSLMDKIFYLLKKNSNSQEKTVDELKKLMAKNSQNVYENTEALKIQSDDHEKELNRVKGRVDLMDQKIDQILNILNKLQK
jgi:hypothetical protein